MRVKDFMDKLNAQISEMGLEEAELTENETQKRKRTSIEYGD